MIEKSIIELHELIKSGLLKPETLIDEVYENIAKYNDKYNAYITIRDKKDVLADLAMASDKKTSLLYGIPYSMKDAYLTKDVRTTAASAILEDFIPPYSATVYKKLQSAGALLIGKANLDAWGHGASTENNDFGPTKNPWDDSRVAGGSSGGSAAAIASSMCKFSIGEDTGGSIRNPSAWTNTTGLKVTYGRVSRYGAIAYASSFDTIGPMGGSAQDLAIILETIAGVDPYDATSSPEPVPNYLQGQTLKVGNLTIGMPKEMYSHGLDPEIKSSIEEATVEFKKIGVKVVDVSLPIAEIALAAYYLIAPSESSSNLARYDGMRYGKGRELFTTENIRRIMIGTYALSSGYYDAYYRKAQKVRTLLIQKYEDAFKKCDVLLMPVNPGMPPKFGQLVNDPIQNMLADIYTTSINQVGVPSLALPAGFSKSGLPIGMQLVGQKFAESTILNLGHKYQSVTHWHTRKPKL